MRHIASLAFLALAACTGGANHLGNPLLLPITGITTSIDNAIYDGQRAPVEDYVSLNYDALVTDIEAGGGTTLTQAFDVASVPEADRADFIAAMEGYDLSQPDNLVVALMVWRD